jgi:hypothetical protein
MGLLCFLPGPLGAVAPMEETKSESVLELENCKSHETQDQYMLPLK